LVGGVLVQGSVSGPGRLSIRHRNGWPPLRPVIVNPACLSASNPLVAALTRQRVTVLGSPLRVWKSTTIVTPEAPGQGPVV
jgi:hypothetical protein